MEIKVQFPSVAMSTEGIPVLSLFFIFIFLKMFEILIVWVEYFAFVFRKEKDRKNSENNVEISNIEQQFEIKKEVVLELLKGIKVEKSQGPDWIYHW